MSHRTSLIASTVVLVVLLVSGPASLAQRVRPVATQRKVEVSLADEAVIRFKKAPKQFDDKGKPVTPTAEQLQAMKGDPKLPGYAALTAATKHSITVALDLSHWLSKGSLRKIVLWRKEPSRVQSLHRSR